MKKILEEQCELWLKFQTDVHAFSVLYRSHVPTPQTQVKKLILPIHGVTSPLDNRLLFKCKKDGKEHKKYQKHISAY